LIKPLVTSYGDNNNNEGIFTLLVGTKLLDQSTLAA